MAGKGINIPLVADVSKFIAGTDDVDRALDGVGDSLDELARDAQASGDKLETGFRDAFDSVRTDADRMHTDVSDSVTRAGDDGKTRAKEAGSEIGSELAANIGEGIGSGQTDLADVLRGTLGGLVSVPGLGLAAIGAGLMVGILSGFLNKGKEAQEKAKAAGAAMFNAFQDGVLDAQERQDNLTKALGVDDMFAAMQKVNELSKTLDVDPVKALHALLYPEQSVDKTLAAQLEAASHAADDVGLRATSAQAHLFASRDAASDFAAAMGTARDAIDSGRTSAEQLKAAVEQIPGKVKVQLDVDSAQVQNQIRRLGFRWDGS